MARVIYPLKTPPLPFLRLGHKTILTLLCSITSELFLFSASFNLLRSRRRHLFHTMLLTIRVIMNFQYFLLFSYSSYVTLVLFFSVLPAHDYCLPNLISFTFLVGCSPPTVTEGWSWGKTRFSRILSQWAITPRNLSTFKMFVTMNRKKCLMLWLFLRIIMGLSWYVLTAGNHLDRGMDYVS